MEQVQFKDLGCIDYQEAWDMQEALFKQSIDEKMMARRENRPAETQHHLLFCEHPHVYTLGKSGSIDHLKLDESELEAHHARFYKINRGGDITYHGPGQLVVYPILDLDRFFTDIHKYMRFLEESVILTLAEFGIKGERFEGLTGVWVDPGTANARKICAMGVKSSRWVTMHGIGFNVNSDLSYFEHIVPCGIQDKGVTSMAKELGKSLDMQEVSAIFKAKFAEVFNITYC